MDKEHTIYSFKRKFVYFEKQLNSKLCGLHSLNSLLQAPYFDEITLSEIAQELDKLEQNLYDNNEIPQQLFSVIYRLKFSFFIIF